MKRTFVEGRVFTARTKSRLSDEAFRALQKELMTDPHKGRVIPGCGGLRKIRAGDEGRGKGKRGGVRVIYLNIPEAERIELLTIYAKEEKDDLTETENRALRRLVEELRAEAIASFRRKGGRT